MEKIFDTEARGGRVFFSGKFFFPFLGNFFLTMNIGLFLFILEVRLQKSCNTMFFSSGCCPKNTIVLQNEQKLHEQDLKSQFLGTHLTT